MRKDPPDPDLTEDDDAFPDTLAGRLSRIGIVGHFVIEVVPNPYRDGFWYKLLRWQSDPDMQHMTDMLDEKRDDFENLEAAIVAAEAIMQGEDWAHGLD